MKQLLFIAFLIFQSLSFAQVTEGVIEYTEEVKNPHAERIRERLESRGMKVDIPDVNTSSMNLYFNSNESIYKKNESKESKYDGPQRGGGMRMRFFFGRGGRINANGYYRNLEEKKRLQEEEILGKQFLISDDERVYEWKITGRKELIGRYEVMEAVSITEKDTIQAWFTPQIPVPTGPAEFSQLPGVILRVDINQGKRVIYANTIELRELTEEEKVEKPSKGKKVSQEEFIAIREEKMQELKEMYGNERANEMINR